MAERSRAHFQAGRSVAPDPLDEREGAALQAVVIPLTVAELSQAIENFDAWDHEFVPMYPGRDRFADLVVVLNTGETSEVAQSVRGHRAIAANFRSVHVLSADLQGADDAYKIGDATGANNLFFFALGALHRYSVSLLMETDVQPMRAGWLSDAAECVTSQMGTKWVMGAQYRGGGPMGEEYWRHVNGNAFYRTGSPKFAQFYFDEFLPFYGEQYDNHGFRFGYDAAHEQFLRTSEDRHRARVVLSKFGYTDFVVNLRINDDDSAVPRGENLEGVLWHRGGWMKRDQK